MRTYRLPQRAGQHTFRCENQSQLTLNIAHLQLGLLNLLDLRNHDIETRDGISIHHLTFHSGASLRIECDGRTVQVEGRVIHYESSHVPPYATWLGDPSKAAKR